MPDISMCANRECPARGTCYRYLAHPSPSWQAYGGFNPGEAGCDYHWPVKERSGTIRTLAQADRENGKEAGE